MQTTNGTGNAAARSTESASPESRKPATASASSLHRQAIKSPTPPDASGTSSPTASAVAEAFFVEGNVDDGADTWAEMGDLGDDDEVLEPPPTTAAQADKRPGAVASPAPFDDGEPDFAGWLAAQAQKKKPGANKPLPKGLTKSTATKKAAPRPAAKPIVAKKIDMKPKETEDEDDGWGDGW
ncbi:hypothetical protein CDD83_7324 [Cordyceps sp. RAO-2017]|nr:hypothetical protein CDD83_7324 [Cordyceps sp. RAO-2017]